MHLVHVDKDLFVFLRIPLFDVLKETQHIGHHSEPVFHYQQALNEYNVVSTQSAYDTKCMNELPQVESQVHPKGPTFVSVDRNWGRQRLRSLPEWH